MRINILKPILASLALAASACTGNYLEINSNPNEADKDQMQADGYAIGAALSAIAGTVISTDVNTAQFTDCLLGGPMGGYFADANANWANTISNYNAKNDWTRVFMFSDQVIPMLYSNLRELSSVTDDPIALAIAEVMKVAAMHRVTDTYGPIPYSQLAQNNQIQVAYDSQEQVFDKFFEELDHAIGVLTEHRTGGISTTADFIYGGRAEKWCRLANSLKLRLAMRIVYADPEKAREKAEEAVYHEIGVIESNADNARVTAFGDKGNPLFVATRYNSIPTNKHGDTPCLTGGDTHAAADIICYMNGYSDARREAYFEKSEWAGVDYVGLRRGITIPELATTGHKFSGVKLSLASPLYWFNAAEVAFLKAEAKAVFGFDMRGEARDFYNKGIQLSFEQWNAKGADAYLSTNNGTPQRYSDPSFSNPYNTELSSIKVPWDEGATKAQMQERIIIQKWIANWQLGNEAWADYRRTGFPKLIPASDTGNKSGGVVDSNLGARRMPYPQEEYTNNGANITSAVSSLLKGADNMATRVWWDCNPQIN